MKKAIFLLLLLFATSPAWAQQKQPNIIFFLVDDMGWQDTSVPFWEQPTPANSKFHTPNMARLARQGVKFTNAYAASICTPTRVSLLTGMNAAHHRVTNWTSVKNQRTDHLDDDQLQPPQWNMNGLSPTPGAPYSVHATTLPELLSRAGYYTILSGKAHFSVYDAPGANPLNLGFQKNIGGSAIGNPASFLSEQEYGNLRHEQKAVQGLKPYWHTGTFLTDALTTEAIKAMDTAQIRRQPFFLYLAHYAVHLPFDPDKRYIDKYLQAGLAGPEAAYAALVEGMDASLGRLLDYLDERKLTDNTIVVFMSDNGGLTRDPRSGPPDTQNYPLRAGKGSLYEGGVREPLLVRWPGVTRSGTVNSQYLIIEDFFPTLLEMAGVADYKTVQPVDGRSLVPYLRHPGKRDNQRALIWHYPNKWYPGPAGITSYVSAIRQGDWKLLYFAKPGRLELYNLKNDLGEQHNLVATNPKKTRQLAQELTRKLKAWDAQLPLYKSTGQPVPYPDEVAGR
ncbi:sulfatase (plasmid) [Hymenobacter sp. NBH84]|uniref:sulfatase n=1 Tax=Hymenobacter sp. NBH84 TaxID=2596915 RepID=UPI001628A8BC|nr:sulfatase [Hymenobacter sp. NBH84]QNE41963.1 sulfatase [Hymenobacter sp. NBH84]